jgi:hypothetical protein
VDNGTATPITVDSCRPGRLTRHNPALGIMPKHMPAERLDASIFLFLSCNLVHISILQTYAQALPRVL